MRHWLLVLVIIGLAGCVAPTLNETRKAAIRNVAVVSAIGDDVTLFRVFGFEDLKPKRVDWNFDKIASDAVIQSVRAQNTSVSIVQLGYDPNVLAAGIHKHESFQSFAEPARIEPVLRQLTSGKSIDTIIVIARNSSENGALLRYEGVGIVTERSSLKGAPITPFAGLALFVIDGASMQVLSKQTTLVKGSIYNVNPLIEFMPIGGPAPFLPGFRFPMDDEQKAFLKPLLQEVVLKGTQGLMRSSGF